MTGSPVRIEGRGPIFRLTVEHVVEASVDDVFAFFAEPRNLERITPPWLRFRIVGEPPPMERGALIDYRLRLRGIPLAWRSEITDWRPPHGFVDVQRRGPFTRWEHEHVFSEAVGGTRVRDAVEYSMPLSRLANRLVVARDLRAIFEHRRAVIAATIDPMHARARPAPA
jgi:ligand-binding SRPBCC domain-containing protein